MPIYEYACQDCGEQAEVLVRSGSAPECPKCGSEKLSKLLSIVASPSRGDAPASGPGKPPGSCGAGCGCHPRG